MLDTLYKPSHGSYLYLTVFATFVSFWKADTEIHCPFIVESKEDKIRQRKASVRLKISEGIL